MTEAEVGGMPLLALKWKGVMIRDKCASPRRWKNQGKRFPLRASRREPESPGIKWSLLNNPRFQNSLLFF